MAWAKTKRALPNSKLGKAIQYLINQYPYIRNYLKDGRLELSNNLAERNIKMFVIDRKNFLFCNTPSGAEGSATMFSIIMTAKANNLDPYKYLKWIFDTAPTLSETDKNWAYELLPWNAPEDCKI
ncbi:MAG: hypothetical protein DBX59_04965 [Bacillota bacterium]|nr:MAG: hypothetical protein DBX59_04965 [Bacillota bacterium]